MVMHGQEAMVGIWVFHTDDVFGDLFCDFPMLESEKVDNRNRRGGKSLCVFIGIPESF